MIDLHTHSNCSDGQYSPTELIQLAKRRGIAVIALTDHDTVSGISDAKKQAESADIRFISGIEISAASEVGSMHILGYNINHNFKPLKEVCEWYAEQRFERAKKILDVLGYYGVELHISDVERYSKNKLFVRPHFALAMVDAGYVSSVAEAFEKYLDTYDIKSIKRKKLSADESFQLICEAGGIPVIAHPSKLKIDNEELDNFISHHKKSGLMGMECHYSTHSAKQTMEYIQIAEKHSIYVTGGSDFHGEKVKPHIELGTGIDNSLNIKFSDVPLLNELL